MGRSTDFFKQGLYYHVYNRGTDKRDIVTDKKELYYFLDNLILCNSGVSLNGVDSRKKIKEKIKDDEKGPLVAIVAYAILPNHFHLLLKEIKEGGISKFMQRFSTSFTMFFNEKHERSGVLFQGRFKAKEVDNPLALSAYVNLNYVHHNLDPKEHFVRTSMFEYAGKQERDLICDPGEIKFILDLTDGDFVEYRKIAKEYSEIFVETHKREKDFLL